MRSAIVSDIHGNLGALRACLADASGRGCERTICLGDLVGGGDNDLGVVREVRRLGIPCVRGNHDELASLQGSSLGRLAPDSPELAFLKGLAPSIIEGDVLYTHITPRPIERKIRDRYEAWNAFEESTQRLAFIGHTHIPLIFSLGAGTVGAAAQEYVEHNRPFRLDPDRRYIVCVGAVGYGRDGIKAARYAVYDDGEGTVEIRRVEAPVLDL